MNDYSHLLCRPENTFDEKTIDSNLTGKRILITGAGGSIGSALAHRIAAANPARLYLLGHGEDSIFQLQNSLQALWDNGALLCRTHFIIADVHSETTCNLFKEPLGLDYVFHTAAHKHVGLMEDNPRAAFANNTQATIWLARACKQYGARLVYVSTDKAVSPTTVMGASKKLAEAWVDANCDNAVTVRLGNVLGSKGSIVEIIEKLIHGRKGPDDVPLFVVRHPKMARYFITAREAVGAILSAGTGFPGKYSLDMGKPLLIEPLARQLASTLVKVNVYQYFAQEKLTEDLLEPDEKYDACDSAFQTDGLQSIKRKVEPALISAILEIVENHANTDLPNRELGKLIVAMARKA